MGISAAKSFINWMRQSHRVLNPQHRGGFIWGRKAMAQSASKKCFKSQPKSMTPSRHISGGDLPLKNKLFGIRTPYYKLSVKQRSQVVGCFKQAEHFTPIDQLYPYEMWRAPPVSLTLTPVQDSADIPPANKQRFRLLRSCCLRSD